MSKAKVVNIVHSLKYTAPGGNRLEFTNAPLDMAATMLITSMTKEARAKVLAELQEQVKADEQAPT